MHFDELVHLLASGLTSNTFTGVHGHLSTEGRWVEVRVWRNGRLGRVEDMDGRVEFIAGASTNWGAYGKHRALVAFPRQPNRDDIEYGAFANAEPLAYWREWLSKDAELVMRTLRETDVDGRPAWAFTCPEVKGRRPEITVDSALGLVLLASSAEVGLIESWIEVLPYVDVDDDLFRATSHN